MPSRADMLGQRAIGGEKALGLSWRLEALQAPLALAGRLVGMLRAPYPLKKTGMMSTKRIFTIVMPGKIMA